MRDFEKVLPGTWELEMEVQVASDGASAVEV